MADEETTSNVIGSEVNRLRKEQGLSIKKLAEKCQTEGATRLTANALENIEYGRRDKDGRRRREIVVEELLLLSLVLGVNPVDLVVPPSAPADQPYKVAEGVYATAGAVRAWFSGQGFLNEPGTVEDLSAAFHTMPGMSLARSRTIAREWMERNAARLGLGTDVRSLPDADRVLAEIADETAPDDEQKGDASE